MDKVAEVYYKIAGVQPPKQPSTPKTTTTPKPATTPRPTTPKPSVTPPKTPTNITPPKAPAMGQPTMTAPQNRTMQPAQQPTASNPQQQPTASNPQQQPTASNPQQQPTPVQQPNVSNPAQNPGYRQMTEEDFWTYQPSNIAYNPNTPYYMSQNPTGPTTIVDAQGNTVHTWQDGELDQKTLMRNNQNYLSHQQKHQQQQQQQQAAARQHAQTIQNPLSSMTPAQMQQWTQQQWDAMSPEQQAQMARGYNMQQANSAFNMNPLQMQQQPNPFEKQIQAYNAKHPAQPVGPNPYGNTDTAIPQNNGNTGNSFTRSLLIGGPNAHFSIPDFWHMSVKDRAAWWNPGLYTDAPSEQAIYGDAKNVPRVSKDISKSPRAVKGIRNTAESIGRAITNPKTLQMIENVTRTGAKWLQRAGHVANNTQIGRPVGLLLSAPAYAFNAYDRFNHADSFSEGLGSAVLGLAADGCYDQTVGSTPLGLAVDATTLINDSPMLLGYKPIHQQLMGDF